MYLFHRVHDVLLCISLLFTPIYGSIYASINNKKVIYKESGKITAAVSIGAVENIVKKCGCPK